MRRPRNGDGPVLSAGRVLSLLRYLNAGAALVDDVLDVLPSSANCAAHEGVMVRA